MRKATETGDQTPNARSLDQRVYRLRYFKWPNNRLVGQLLQSQCFGKERIECLDRHGVAQNPVLREQQAAFVATDKPTFYEQVTGVKDSFFVFPS
jgi:hypothetical protein